MNKFWGNLRIPSAASQNLGWLLIDRVGRSILAFGVGVAVARHLQPHAFGTYSLALAWAQFGQVFAELGLDAVCRRKIIEQPQLARQVIRAAFIARLVAAAVCAAVGAVVIVAAGLDSVFAILGILVFQPALFVADLWFQATLNAKIASRAMLAAAVVCAVVRVALIWAGGTVIAFAWATVVEMVITALCLCYGFRHARVPALSNVSMEVLGLTKEALPILASGLAVVLYMRLDVFMLAAMAGNVEVGVFAAGARLIEIWYFLPIAIVSSYLPQLIAARDRSSAEHFDKLRDLLRRNAIVGWGVVFLVCGCAPWLMPVLYGQQFSGAATVAIIQSFSFIFVCSGVVRTQFLINNGNTNFYFCATLGGLLVNCVANFILIPRMGAAGAAVATLASQAFATWLSSYLATATRGVADMQLRAMLFPFGRLWRFLARP